MASILDLLAKIKEAKYGKDVRQSIHDAIQQCYNDATGNPDSIAAHVGDTENPHDVTAEQIGLKTAAADISALQSPEFEDYTADGATVPDARAAISEMTSKMSMFTFLGKAKAALMGLVTLGEMRALLVNNGLTTESGKYFLDAAYGKTLADLIAANATSITKLNSDLSTKLTKGSLFSAVVSAEYSIEAGSEASVTAPCTREGYTELCIAGFSGLTSTCMARQFFISGGSATVSAYNRGTSKQTGTCNIRVLYRAN